MSVHSRVCVHVYSYSCVSACVYECVCVYLCICVYVHLLSFVSTSTALLGNTFLTNTRLCLCAKDACVAGNGLIVAWVWALLTVTAMVEYTDRPTNGKGQYNC